MLFSISRNAACRIIRKTIISLALVSIPAISFAENRGFFAFVEGKPISELWLNPGFYSLHFQRDRGLNDNNIGLGGEYRYSTTNSVALGVYKNSDSMTSRYVGWYWQPLAMGSARAGAVIGLIDGYHTWNGDWFVAAIPAASIEYKNIGASMLLIPSIRNKIFGSITLQLRIKVF